MSLLSFDEIRIGLSPQRVELARVGRGLRARKVVEEVLRDCQPIAGHANWSAALDTLEALLAELPAKSAAVSVTLSNHFVRYMVLPWQEDLSDPAEIVAAAAQRFSHLYGEAARRWDVRISQSDYGHAGIACAIDSELLLRLGSCLNRGGLRLISVQPLLVSAFNTMRRRLDDAGALVVVEPGRVCLGVFLGGAWQAITSSRSGVGDPVRAIERELAALAGAAMPSRLDVLDLAANGQWAKSIGLPTQVHPVPVGHRCRLALSGGV